MPRSDIRLSILIAAIAACLSACPATAADALPDAARLKSLEQTLEQSAAERERLKAQETAATRELEAARAETIAVAKDIQGQEYSLMVIENRIGALEKEAAGMTAALGRRDAQMAEVLAALERLALRPSDALSLYPLSPDDAVRSAILLRAAVPGIQQSASKLQAELADLYRLRSEIVAQKEKVAAGAARLLERHRKLDELTAKKAEQQVAVVARSQDAEQRMQQLTREAQDLRELFAKLAEEKARRVAEEKKIAAARKEAEEKATADSRVANAPPRVVLKPPPGVAPIAPNTHEQLAALPKAEDPSGGRSFTQARGTMPYPVVGSLTSKYGESGDDSARSKGIVILSRPGAPVVAPFDGVVAFAGPFRGYGMLLIIEHSEGYHTLLAGMARIECAVGQRVLAGEPVGAMENDGAPSLYVELRRDGQPINPLPWLADRTGTSSG